MSASQSPIKEDQKFSARPNPEKAVAKLQVFPNDTAIPEMNIMIFIITICKNDVNVL